MSYIRYNNKLVRYNNKYVVQSPPPPDERFITEWNMTSTSFTLPTTSFTGGVFDYYVDWGDESEETHVTSSTSPTHTYPSTGTYQIKIRGSFPRIYINNGTHRDKLTKIINWGNVNFRTFQNAFYGCSNLISLPLGPIIGANLVAENAFRSAFSECTSLTSIPTGLFDNCPLVSTYGFYETFRSCVALQEIPSGLFDNNTAVSSYGFGYTFYACTGIQEIPSGLFDNNTAVSSNGFYATFLACYSIQTIPSGLFDNNILVSTNGFDYTFAYCTSLTTLPNYLFKNNLLVSTTGFYQTFYGCNNLTLNPWIFYADGEQSTRFAGKTISFLSCFSRTTWTGSIQGTAPDLWNCIFDSVTSTDCFNGAGNSVTSLSNYNDIPIEWI